VKSKSAQYVPHSAGRFQAKRFKKAQCPIVERLTNSIMMHGRNNGKKVCPVPLHSASFSSTSRVVSCTRFSSGAGLWIEECGGRVRASGPGGCGGVRVWWMCRGQERSGGCGMCMCSDEVSFT